MTASGPERQFAAMQYDAGNRRISGRSADATGTGAPQGPKAKQPYAIAMKNGASRLDRDRPRTVAYVLLVAFAMWVGLGH